MSIPLKTITLFFLRVVLFYTLLIIPWPGLTHAYHQLYCKVGSALFYRIGGSGSVSFSILEKKSSSKDTKLSIETWGSSKARGRGELTIDAMYTGYKPTIFLIALVLATPSPWSRRWRSLIWGFILVNFFVAFRVWIQLMDVLSNDNPMRVYELSVWMKIIVSRSAIVLLQSPATSYIVPLFIWGLVALRSDDIPRLLSGTSSKRTSKPKS